MSDDALSQTFRGCQRTPRASVDYLWRATPPEVMGSLTTVTMVDLVNRLPGAIGAVLRLPLRWRFGASWASLPVFSGALAMHGTLRSSQPLRSAVLDLPCPGWPPARVGTLLAVGIWVDHTAPMSRLRVFLLRSTHTPTRAALATVVATILTPVWRLFTRAWLDAVAADVEQTVAKRRIERM